MSTRVGRWLLNTALWPCYAAGAVLGAYARLGQLVWEAVRLGFLTGYGDTDESA